MFIVDFIWSIIAEIVYLVRHPWTINWTAVLVWVMMIGIGVFVLITNTIPYAGVILIIASFPVYYLLKINLNRKRPSLMKKHHQHYYKDYSNRKKGRGDKIIKKITSS